MQYTIRNIPDYLDASLRDFAQREGKSLNPVAVAALVRGVWVHRDSSVQWDWTRSLRWPVRSRVVLARDQATGALVHLW